MMLFDKGFEIEVSLSKQHMHPSERSDLLHSQMIEYINRSLLSGFFFLFSIERENAVRGLCQYTVKHGTLDLILRTVHADAVVVPCAVCAIRQKQSSNILDDVDI